MRNLDVVAAGQETVDRLATSLANGLAIQEAQIVPGAPKQLGVREGPPLEGGTTGLKTLRGLGPQVLDLSDVQALVQGGLIGLAEVEPVSGVKVDESSHGSRFVRRSYTPVTG